ncbi:putative 2-keto-3-deoxy-galactonate aldolase YagE [Thalassoglobus neptunius]|uniref:Putative 2-keto-3-deoxy-galactonate aldolase YagE n=1 Tax=Thalassoglobus neptunius TaxID=1938619 RepID=A0A5C5X7A1_9PLAN|nr:dihydrodipicolinate synthase family protein [Thalassoglobus neptunius]TWT57902.1 putative 2-keto-3-deoxy-galactonate aldolase YagE [Thalassoglobus neptunius]
MSTESISFRGILPPLITPLLSRDEIDIVGTHRLIDHVIAGDVHGLFVLGTSGEAPSLSHATQREFLKVAADQIGTRVPMLVGVTDTSLSESIEFSNYAAECGADAVVLATPYYFPMHQDDLKRYVTEFASEVSVPFLLYNMPSHTKVSYEIDTLRDLLELPNLLGVKDSSGNMQYFNKLVELKQEREDFVALMGPEELMGQSVLMGGDGGISGGANLVPELYVSLYEAAVRGELREVLRLQQQVMRLSRKLYEVGAPPTSYLTGIKSALGIRGICSDRMCEPLYQMPAEKQQTIRRHLEDLGIVERVVS